VSTTDEGRPRPRFSQGRRPGVFAQRSIPAGETIERAPVLAVPGEEWRLLVQTDLVFYLVDWPAGDAEVALPLGYGALYNHAATPNAATHKRLDELVMEVVAVRHIAAGEEVTVGPEAFSKADMGAGGRVGLGPLEPVGQPKFS
jgi:hypothetical protein